MYDNWPLHSMEIQSMIAMKHNGIVEFIVLKVDVSLKFYFNEGSGDVSCPAR